MNNVPKDIAPKDLTEIVMMNGAGREDVQRAIDAAVPWDAASEPMRLSGTAKGAAEALTVKEVEWENPVPFTDHALPPFPVEVLPDAMAGMVSEVAASIQVPVDMAGMMALATVAAASARRCIVQVGDTHTETLNLYVVVTGEPGERKSGADEAMKVPLVEAENELQSAFALVKDAEQEQRAYQDKRIAVLRERAAKEDDPGKAAETMQELNQIAASLAEVPSEPRLLADDITPEKLADLMAEQGGAMAIISAEGGIFGMMAGRYNDGKVNLDLFLKAYSGEDVRVDRKSGGSIHVRRPRLTFGLALQPHVLESLSDTPAFRGRGLLGRFLYALPTSRVGSRLYQNRPIAAAVRQSYNAAILSILSLPQADPQDVTVCHALRLQGSALDTWAEYANDVEQRQSPGGDLAGIRDWASKLAGAVARIAGGFHLVENAQSAGPCNKPIASDTVLRAWAVGQYLIAHALAAYGHMGADPNVSLARRILAWVEKSEGTEFSLRDCHRANRSVGSPRELEPALTLLCERGFLRLKHVEKRQGPGQPKSPVYEVNPMGQNGQNTQK